MARPAVLLFDLGGVLVRNTHLEDLPKLVPATPGADLHDLWLSSPSVQAFERGKIGVDEFAARFVEEWRLPLSPAAFLERFASWPKGFYSGAADMLTRLRPDYRIAYLSNCNEVHWREFRDILTYADDVFASHLCGLVKPDPAIFQLVISALGVAADAISFFDDSRRNVDAARDAGMDAHLVKGFEALQAKLRALGLDR